MARESFCIVLPAFGFLGYGPRLTSERTIQNDPIAMGFTYLLAAGLLVSPDRQAHTIDQCSKKG